MKKKIIIYTWACILISTPVLYFLVIRDDVKNLLSGQGPSYITWITEIFYPRLLIEKERFSGDFFLSKADQVLLRFEIINLILITFYYLLLFNSSFKRKWILFWIKKTSIDNINFLVRLFYAGLLFYSFDWFWDFEKTYQLSFFYKPLLFARLTGAAYPDIFILKTACCILYFLCLVVILNRNFFWPSAIASFTFIVLQFYFYGFEKIDHTYTTLNYSAMLMPFLIYYSYKENVKNEVPGTFLIAIQLFICLSYFQAGLEKLLISGMAWFDPATLQHHLAAHPTILGHWIIQYDWMCSLLLASVLFFEIGFISIMFANKAKWVFLPMGVLFHWGTVLLINVGGWLSSWIFVYIFFIDWSYAEIKFNHIIRFANHLFKSIINK